MSHLIFISILTGILGENINILNYKLNHPSGNIGQNLMTIKDVLIKDYPKFSIKNEYNLNEVLLQMTKYGIGICCFINNDNSLYGILTDGDIRRILIDNSTYTETQVYLNNKINIKYINTQFYYENNLNKYLKDCTKLKSKFIPVIDNLILIGLIKN